MEILKEDLDFEITFFENLLKKNPKFIDALIALGETYTKRGLYKKAFKIDNKLVKLKPNDPVVLYNLACDYSLLKESNLCLRALEKALKLGWRDFKFMEEDKDLEYIRKDKRFRELINKYKKTALIGD